MSSGGSKRRSIREGTANAQAATDQGIVYLQPYMDRGNEAAGSISNLLGNNGSAAMSAAGDKFKDSLFYSLGQDAFQVENDRIGQSFANNGAGLYSGAKVSAAQDAAHRYGAESFLNYLNTQGNVANMGLGAAGQAAGMQGNMAGVYSNSGQALADTRMGLRDWAAVAQQGAQAAATAFGG